MKIEKLSAVTEEVLEAFQRLTPQLNPHVKPPGAAELDEILASQCTEILMARGEDDSIIGILALVVFRTPNGRHAWIEDVVVDEAARGRGVGEALSKAAIARAGERGAGEVNLTSRPERQPANRLYQRLGFELRQTNVYRLKLMP